MGQQPWSRTVAVLWLSCLVVCIAAGRPTANDQCPVDVFHFLRQVCWSEGTSDHAGESQPASLNQAEVIQSINSQEIVEIERSHSANVVVQPYPSTPDENAELLSFEAWKEKQLRETSDSNVQERESFVDDVHQEETTAEYTKDTTGPDAQAVNQTHAENELKLTNSSSQKGLSRENLKQSGDTSGKTNSGSVHRYNYASPDCSARVISSSSSSQHASSVLHKSKDRYMLTPCNAKEHWVVIELCDEIRIESVEIGMFEFFSGVVKDVRISVDRGEDFEEEEEDNGNIGYGQEWEDVGQFCAKNVRGTQMFSLSQPTSFHRFIRLDFPSYYGKEYYCPISSVKVYGMNQMEAFKWESRRNKQREDEWLRKQSEAEKRRQLPPPSENVVSKGQQVYRDDNPTDLSRSLIAPITTEAGTAVYAVIDSIHTTAIPPQDTTYATETITRIVLSSTIPIAGTNTNLDDSPNLTVNSDYSATTATIISARPHEVTRIYETVSDKEHTDQSVVSTKTIPNSPRETEAAEISESQDNDISKSPTVHSTRTAVLQSSSASPRPTALKADSSESIYAFIVRRLNALEGNATLGMMYVEEQIKSQRALLWKLEHSITDWKLGEAQNQRMLVERERRTTQETVDEIMSRMEDQESSRQETLISLQHQLAVLTDEITWEKRRGIAQLCLLLVVIGLAALSHTPAVDVHPRQQTPVRRSSVRRLFGTARDIRSAMTEQLDQLPPPDSRFKQNRDGTDLDSRSRQNQTKSVPSPRRPATPSTTKKSRPALTLAARATTERLDGPRSALLSRPRYLIPPNAHAGGKRLARNSHLHDIDRMRRKLHLDTLGDTPTKGGGRESASSATPRQSTEESGKYANLVTDSEMSDYDLASASEVESKMLRPPP